MSEHRRYRVEATSADAGLLVWGGSREELFENAALGLTRILAEPRSVRAAEERAVRVEGRDLPALLVAWLSEFVYLFDAEGFLGRVFALREIGERHVAGSARGECYDPARHRLRAAVKGVTYHRLEIREGGGRLRARLVVDL
jgi:SHS2 domain-containing protein